MAKLTKSTLRPIDGNWITGMVGPFKVSAKAFIETSHYGMPEDARISKLWIKSGDQVVFNYDRNDTDVNTIASADLALVVAAVAAKIK